MRKFISNIMVIVMVMFNLIMVMCSSNNISENDISEMKDIVDKVLSYDGDYDDEVSKYIDSQTFNESNYVVFYSYLL